MITITGKAAEQLAAIEAAQSKPAHYEIVDRKTGAVVGHAKTLSGARRSVDRRDNAYGAYRYFHRKVTA